MRLAVQRVQHLGPVDRDDADAALVLDLAEAVFGPCSLLALAMIGRTTAMHNRN